MTPQSAAADSSPYAGEPMGCAANLYRTIGKRQFCGFVSPLDTGLTQALYQYSVRAPPKSLPCVRGGGSALAEPVGLSIPIRAAKPHTYSYQLSAVCLHGSRGFRRKNAY